MINQKKLIEYKGVLTFDVIAQLINNLKVIMEKEQEQMNLYKRILIIMVESLENICKYSESQVDNLDLANDYPSVFTLSKKGETYVITTGNLIRREDQRNIEDRISNINQLNPAELRKLYRNIISDGNFNSEGGAGLGFIEMAKSCKKKIEYQFQQVNNTNSFFTINMEITK
jgi:hypothetical protein